MEGYEILSLIFHGLAGIGSVLMGIALIGVLALIDDAPAVPQEMSAREFFEEFQRMCHTVDGCGDCPIMGMDTCAGFPCRYRAYLYADKAVAVVEGWAREHPEERSEQ